jgi:hypothetical protein
MTSATDTPLRRSTAGTFFRGRKFFQFDWAQKKQIGAERDLDELNLKRSLLSGVDAACSSPLDPDLIWLFRGDEVVDYRVSKGRPIAAMTSFGSASPATLDAAFLDGISKRKIKDHPIFRVLPADFQAGVTGVVLDPRTFADVGGRQDAPPDVTSASVVVTPTSDGGAVSGGGAIVVASGESALLWHTLRFAAAGKYHASVALDTGTDQGGSGSTWKVGLGTTGEEDEQPRPALDYDVSSPDEIQTLIVTAQADGAALPRVRLTLTLTGPSPATTKIYERQLMLFRGRRPDGGLPFVYVFKGTTGRALFVTSLRTAVAIGAPWTMKAAVDAILNGAGPSADRVYQLSGTTEREHVLSSSSTAFAADVPARPVDAWCRIFSGSLPPQAAVPVLLGSAPAAPGAATPNGSAVVVDPQDLDPPETVVAIPGQHAANVTPDLATWISSLPRCSVSTKGGPWADLVPRMRAFVDRITTAGDLPDFLRTFVAVRVKDGTKELCYYAMPDFLSAGSEASFLRLPLTPLGGQKAVDWLNGQGAELVQTTAKIALQIFTQPGTQRLTYVGMGQDRLATSYSVMHQALIEAERGMRGFVLGALTAGHCKEVVVGSNMPKSKGVLFWGGVYAWNPSDPGVAPAEIRIAQPTIHGDAEGNPRFHPITLAGFFHGEPSHTNEPDHDEYAQARRVIHRWAWMRDTSQSKTWSRKDILDLIKTAPDSNLVAGLPFASPRYPGDFDTVHKT